MSASAANQPRSSTDERLAISESMKVWKEGDKMSLQFVSKQFRDSDADVTILSSDGVRFKLHKKNLALYTGGFPPLEFGTSNRHEEATLSERAIILDLLFRFVYPHRQLDLGDLEISVVSELADAAAKYEVYNAITMCKTIMKYEIPNHPLDVFAYAGRYNYLDLMDKAAPLVLGTPFHTAVDNIPATVLAAWYRYLAAWDIPRSKWVGAILKGMATRVTPRHGGDHRGTISSNCDVNCQSHTLLLELTNGMVAQERLLELARAVKCHHCFFSGSTSILIQEVPTQFSSFPKFRTFLHHEGAN